MEDVLKNNNLVYTKNNFSMVAVDNSTQMMKSEIFRLSRWNVCKKSARWAKDKKIQVDA